MKKFDYKEFNKRYDKFKNNNLPTPFFDEERQALEYVHFDNIEDNENVCLQVNQSLGKALEGIAQTSLYYSFSIRTIDGIVDEDNIISKKGNKHCHAHSLEEVVGMLYKFPESFNISEEEADFYSKQELDYLNKIQKYLLFIGLKDLDANDGKIPVSRYRNKKHSKYYKTIISRVKDDVLQKISDGKITYKIRPMFENYSGDKDYASGEYQMLLVDNDFKFKFLIEFIKRELKLYKEVKEVYDAVDYDDNDRIIVMHFKVLERFEEKNNGTSIQ